MMWRQVDLVYSFLPLVSIATFWCVVYGQSDIDGPCKACPIECIQKKYTRYWWTTMWGFIITLVALTMDVWGATKTINKNTILIVFETFLTSALNPLFILGGWIGSTVYGILMLDNLREALGNDVIGPLYPWTKSHTKIISGCGVFVNLSPDVHKENSNLKAFVKKVLWTRDLSEALVIGQKIANSEQFNVQLTPNGQLALLRANVLPPYDELKFVRGNSSLGMAIASAQAIGYIYGVVVRRAQRLHVSPIEAIACLLNMVILMKGFLHNFTSLGYRPLLLYLLPEEEAKFMEECKIIQDFHFKGGIKFKLAISIAYGVLLGVGTYFIVNFVKTLSRTCVVPIILFEVSIVLAGIFSLGITQSKAQLAGCNILSIVLLNFVGYVWALVVTFKYWKGEEFDVQSPNYLSQVLPYIG